MRRLFQALSEAGEGAFIIDDQWRIIFWNESAEKLLGRSADEVAGRFCYEVLGGLDDQGRTLCQRYCRLAIKTRRGDAIPNMDVAALSGGGGRAWINVTTFALQTGDPGLGRVIVHLFRDATAKKRNERLIEQILELSNHFREQVQLPDLSIPARDASLDRSYGDLTNREREVLFLLSHGLGTDDIAKRLSISPSTTRNHVQNILSKLDVHSRLEAVAYAYQRGLVDTDGQEEGVE